MYIKLNANHYGYDLIVTAENVEISEDIEERIYPKDDNGKTIINLSPKRDIQSNYLDMISNLLSDMIYYRKEDYDSSELIKSLFEKLPQDVCENLVDKLHRDYAP